MKAGFVLTAAAAAAILSMASGARLLLERSKA